MSRESRRSLREKSIARRVLERGAQRDIDEFLNDKANPVPAEIDYEDEPYDDFLDDDTFYIDDYPDYEDQYDRWDDYPYDDDFDSWMDDDEPAIVFGTIGTYYKDSMNRTYLCCQVHGMTVYVNVLTGRECDVNPYRLEKVG